jgi:hypothetical protein
MNLKGEKMNSKKNIGKVTKKELINAMYNQVNHKTDWEYMAYKIKGERSFRITQYGNGNNFNFDKKAFKAPFKITKKEVEKTLNKLIKLHKKTGMWD